MSLFSQRIQQKCQQFHPFLAREIEITSPLFQHAKAKVADFVAEIQHTSKLAEQQTDPLRTEFYTQRLIQQFALLQNATAKLAQKTTPLATFQSPYRFAKNPHNLPPEQRIMEYRKALRALEEKLSWLIQQQYANRDATQQQWLTQKIEETEYRKQKCLNAILALE